MDVKRLGVLVMFGILMTQLISAGQDSSGTKSQVIWKFENIPLNGIGIAITPDGSEFHIVKGHLRGVNVATTEICAVDDEDCLDKQGEHAVIGAVKVGYTMYRAKGTVTYNSEHKVDNIEVDLYGLDVPYRCLISTEEISLCESEPGPSYGSIDLDIYYDYEGADYVAVGKLDLDDKDYLLTVRGVNRRLSGNAKRVRAVSVTSTTAEVSNANTKTVGQVDSNEGG